MSDTLAPGLYRRSHKAANGSKVEGAMIWLRYSCRGACGQPDCSGTHREPSGTEVEREAKRIRARKLSEVGAGKLVTVDAERTTFADLVEMIEAEYTANGRKSLRRLKGAIAHLRETFGTSRASAISTDRVTTYTAERQSAGAANATVKAELSALKRMFNLARRAERVGRVPYIPMVEVHNTRQGFFTEPEYRAVVAALPADLRPVIEFLWLTGWRKQEALTLTWDAVDFEHAEIRLDPERSKNKDSRVLPFGEYKPLADLLYSQAKRKAGARVFHRSGRAIVDLRMAWRTATKAAGVPGRLIHDLRRSAARRLIAAGVPEQTAMAVLGHKTRSIFARYNIVTKSDLTNATKALTALDGGTGTKQAQIEAPAVLAAR